MIHKTAEVLTDSIGEGTQIWQFSVVLQGAKIGSNCNINCHVFIENDVIIGDNVTVKAGAQIWDGIRVEDNVFIGPNVTFTNHLLPRSKQPPEYFAQTIIKKGASIGANATILPGLTIGGYSLIGAGSVVTKNVPAKALVIGNPARVVGWLNKDGTKMIKISEDRFTDCNGINWKILDGGLTLE
jgi:acetyltransferase-like isoleucine patch superfamily enzyme